MESREQRVASSKAMCVGKGRYGQMSNSCRCALDPILEVLEPFTRGLVPCNGGQ